MANQEILYPITIANFRKIREEGFLYVDKTAYLHKLVSSKESYLFLARPRRFGKSLLVSTMQEYFLGNRSLFEGLDIDRLEPGPWESYPVIRFDLSGNSYLNKGDLEDALSQILEDSERDFGIVNSKTNINSRFENLIKTAYRNEGKPVVILIDEYDSPLTAAIDNSELHEFFRQQLYGFYSVLKKMEEYVRFCFLTGVTRYGKVSIFSGLNNLEDISFLDDYAGICGITEEELGTFYNEGIAQLAKEKEIDKNEAFIQLKSYYDGYHFTESLLDVYNPYSLNRALKYRKIQDYWIESGTPTLILKMLLKKDYGIEKLQGAEVSQSELSELDADTSDPIPLFFQTGYITLKSFNKEDQIFTLGYPNKEVESGILRNILKVYNPQDKALSKILVEMKRRLQEGEPEGFIDCLKTYFATIPPDLKERVARYENYYQTIIYCLLTLLGLETRAEYGTGAGYIDLTISTGNFIYVVELKLNGTAKDAMEQIKNKNYCQPFELDNRKLIRVAIAFSKESQNISDYIID